MSFLNESQLIAIAIIPKFSAFLSSLGSLYIITYVLTSHARRSTTHHRLLAGMSICDLFQSSAQFLTTWPLPSQTLGAKFAIGNITSCTIQGFFSNFSVGVGLYNTSLSVYYLLVIKYNFTSTKIKKLEPILHTIPISYVLLSGIGSIVTKSFNSYGHLCWIAPLPEDCTGDDCERGKKARFFRWLAFTIIILCLILSTFCMISLWLSVRSQDERNQNLRISFNRERTIERRQKRTREVAKQAALYLLAFYVTWIFTICNRAYFNVHQKYLVPLYFLSATSQPLQGAFNVLVYMRKRSTKKKNSESSDSPQRSSTSSQKRGSMTSRRLKENVSPDTVHYVPRSVHHKPHETSEYTQEVMLDMELANGAKIISPVQMKSDTLNSPKETESTDSNIDQFSTDDLDDCDQLVLSQNDALDNDSIEKDDSMQQRSNDNDVFSTAPSMGEDLDTSTHTENSDVVELYQR